MSLDIFWFLPTSGDTRYLGKSDFGRPPTNEYMRQIAVTAENPGYDGLLIPTGSSCQGISAASRQEIHHVARSGADRRRVRCAGKRRSDRDAQSIDGRCRLISTVPAYPEKMRTINIEPI